MAVLSPAGAQRASGSTRGSSDLLEPLIGRDLKQIINQVHWKAPGSLGDFAWHQDSKSRRPAVSLSQPRDLLCPDRPRDRSAHARGRRVALHPGQPFARRSAHGLLEAFAWRGDERHGAWTPSGCRQPTPSTLCSSRATSRCGVPILSTAREPTGRTTSAASTSMAMSAPADCDRGEWAFRNGRPGAARAEARAGPLRRAARAAGTALSGGLGGRRFPLELAHVTADAVVKEVDHRADAGLCADALVGHQPHRSGHGRRAAERTG